MNGYRQVERGGAASKKGEGAVRRWGKITLAVLALCAVALTGALSFSASAAASASGVNLMAVNDRVLDTTVENMPRTVGGVLYVPYTMLSKQAVSINLGVNAMYSNTRRTVLVTDGQRGVIFDIQNNAAEDLNGAAVSARAMVHNATVFLPIDWLCQYFGTITCTRTRTSYGTLIRLKNSAAILSDQDFADAAGPQLKDNLQRYLASITGEGGGEPEPSGGVAQSEAPSGPELFLALRCGQSARDCAQMLENRGQRALFLFTGEELAADDGLARRLAGAGHTLGLKLTEDSVEGCLAEAQRGRTLMAAAARYNVLVVSAPALEEKEREKLVQAGYVVWSSTTRGEDFSSGGALVRGLDLRQVNFVEITCGDRGVSLLRSALSAMEEENCQVYQATAPALA